VSVSAAAQFSKQPKEEQAKQVAKSTSPADAIKAFRHNRQIRSAEPAIDDGPRIVHSNNSDAVAHPIDKVIRFAEFCRANSSETVAASIQPGEVAEVDASIAIVRDWLDQVVVALGGFKTTDIKAKTAETTRGPDNALPTKPAPLAAASDIWPDLPPCLDRRKGRAE
jgi:hypothetical protein